MPSFTIRVYGICIENEHVLVSDEFIYNRYVTKFPGGGLEFGEGTIDGLKREMVEETLQEVEVLDHFYTTDFFVPSAFDPSKQVVGIYYVVKFISPVKFRLTGKPFDFQELKDEAQAFRWIKITAIGDDSFTLPIDQRVGEMLKAKFSRGS